MPPAACGKQVNRYAKRMPDGAGIAFLTINSQVVTCDQRSCGRSHGKVAHDRVQLHMNVCSRRKVLFEAMCGGKKEGFLTVPFARQSRKPIDRRGVIMGRRKNGDRRFPALLVALVGFWSSVRHIENRQKGEDTLTRFDHLDEKRKI